jgi:nitrite reductase/ring-hydroxylating ferredoxin subunit
MNEDQNGNRVDLTQWTVVGGVPDGGILAGGVGEDRVFVWRNGNSLKAYSANCPHLGAPLSEGIVVGATIRCPWHHACFDLATGEAIAAPAFDALLEYPVTFEGSRRPTQFASSAGVAGYRYSQRRANSPMIGRFSRRTILRAPSGTTIYQSPVIPWLTLASTSRAARASNKSTKEINDYA